jgi:cytochrome d ubiquinol oxidase subunit II
MGNMAIFAYSVLSVFLFLYLITAAIDSGGGVLYAYALLVKRDKGLAEIVMRYLSPVWETNNVFLIAYIVGLAGYFPQVLPFYGPAMLIPCAIALVCMLVRGAFFGYHYLNHEDNPTLTELASAALGIASVLIPLALVPFFALADTHLFNFTHQTGSISLLGLITSPLLSALGLLALASIVYLSGLFLLFYVRQAQTGQEQQTLTLFTRMSRWGGIAALLTSVMLGVALYESVPGQLARLVGDNWLFVLSAGVTFLVTQLALCWPGKQPATLIALLSGIAQYAVSFIAYQRIGLPYLVPGVLTLDQALTAPVMAQALTAVFGLGMFLLLPALFILYRLFVVAAANK